MVKTRRRTAATTVQTPAKKKVQKTYVESDSEDRSDSSSSMEDSEDEFRPPEAKVKTRKRKVPGSRPAPTNPETAFQKNFQNQPSTSDDYPPPSQEYVNFDKWYLYNRKDDHQEVKDPQEYPQEEPKHQEPVKPKRIRRDKERIAENKKEYEKYEKEEHPTVEAPKQMSIKEQVQLKQNIIKLQMRRKRKAYQKQLDNGRDPEDSDMAETNEEYERYQKDRKAKMAEYKKEERREYQKEAKQQWIVTRNERRIQFEEYRRAEGDMENIPEELKQAKKAWDWFEANRQCQITVDGFEDHQEFEEPEKEPEEEPELQEPVAPIRTEKKRRQNKEERNEYTKLRYWERVARRKAYQEHLDKGGDPEDEEMAENKHEYERHEKFKEKRRNRQRETKEAELTEEVQMGNHNGYRRQREVTRMNRRNRIEEYRRAGGDMENIPEELKQDKKAWDWFEAQKGLREEEEVSRESQRTEEERRLVQSFQRRFRYVPHSHQQDNRPARPSESTLRNSSTDGSVERDDTAAHSLPSSSNVHWSASRRVIIKQEPADNHEPQGTEELIDDPGRLLHDFYHQGYTVNERNLATLAERTKLNVETCRSFMRTRKALDFFLKRFDYQTELFLEKWFWAKKRISDDVKITPLDLLNFKGRIRNSLGEVNEWFRKRMIDDVLFPIKNYEDPEDYIIRTVNRKVGLVEDDLKAKFYAKGKTTMSTHQCREINKRFNLTPEEANRWLQNNKYFDDLDEYVAQKFDASISELSNTSMIYQMLDHNETRCFELKCKYPDKISDAEFHKKFPPNHPFYTKIRRMIRQEIEKREQSQLDYLPVKMEATNLSTARCIFESILENGKTQKFEIQDEFVKATMGLPISGFVLNEFFKQQCEAANIS